MSPMHRIIFRRTIYSDLLESDSNRIIEHPFNLRLGVMRYSKDRDLASTGSFALELDRPRGC